VVDIESSCEGYRAKRGAKAPLIEHKLGRCFGVARSEASLTTARIFPCSASMKDIWFQWLSTPATPKPCGCRCSLATGFTGSSNPAGSP
jgi:hypothetical protein